MKWLILFMALFTLVLGSIAWQVNGQGFHAGKIPCIALVTGVCFFLFIAFRVKFKTAEEGDPA